MTYYPVGKPTIGEAELKQVSESLLRGQLTQGANVREFEKRFAEYVGSRNAVMCSSGTTALHLALLAGRIGRGDEVIVPDFTYISPVNAIKYVGATPVFVDCDETWNLNLDDVFKKLTHRTKAILPVHVYGNPCNMDVICKIAKDHDLLVIEDAAEAIGGYWNGKLCGTFGNMGVFSFYANKVITTGEGGCIVTDDDDLATSIRFFRGQAQSPSRRFWHEAIGYNYRLTDIQAAIGLAQLNQINTFLTDRHLVISLYRKHLEDTLQFPVVRGAAPWLFTGVASSKYEVVESKFKEKGVEVRPMFVPMHHLPMYSQARIRFPVCDRIFEYGVSLPTYPGLTEADIDYIAQVTREVTHGIGHRTFAR